MTLQFAALRGWLRKRSWAITGGLAIVAFVLGLVGLRQLQLEQRPPVAWSWPDAIYFAIRLFGFDFDLNGDGAVPYGPANLPLSVARFLAPATLAFALIKGVMFAAANHYNLWRISWWSGHAVVCGAGERGRQLALALRRERRNVVVIERDEHCDTLADIRAEGVRVVIGSITDPARQAEARLETASIVAAVTPCVESNLQVVLAASRRTNHLPVHALAYAPRSFAAMFERQQPFAHIDRGRECGFFDHDAAAARLLVQLYAPNLVPTLLHERRPPRILVAGDGEIIPELVGVLVTQCQYADAGVPRVTLVTVDRDTVARDFPVDHPELGLVADVRTVQLTLPQMLRMELRTMVPQPGDEIFDLAFVACREDVDTLSLARNLAQQAGCITGHVVAGLQPSTQLKRLFTEDQPLPGVMLHDLVALGCSTDVVLRGRLDEVARSIHESYVQGQLALGRKIGETPTMLPWEQLTDGVRQANRAQADHIPIKQRTLEISPSDATIEALAAAEHRRWMAEKIVAGWRHATTRDDARRLHPSIRPYEDLSEEEKKKDRDTVRTAVAGG